VKILKIVSKFRIKTENKKTAAYQKDSVSKNFKNKNFFLSNFEFF
jgi:hypothetical protein